MEEIKKSPIRPRRGVPRVIAAAEGALKCKAVLKQVELSGAGENGAVLDGVDSTAVGSRKT
jgi:hypothetical protein